MITEIVKYGAISEIAAALDKKIAHTKTSLGEYLGKLDEIRNLAEKSKKIRDTVMKLSGKKNAAAENLDEIAVDSLKIVLDANAFHELTAIESAVRSHQERLLVLQKARDALKPLDQLGDTEGLNFLVLENEGVPERILINGA